MEYPRLNLPSVKLRASMKAGKVHVWDELRERWLLLTPEEWVRRHVVGFVIKTLCIDPVNIVQEYSVCIEGMFQRADIVVVEEGRPLLLVECKCADVAIDSYVLDQAVRYNHCVGARYVMLTNGLVHYFYVTYDGINYSPLDKLPELRGMR